MTQQRAFIFQTLLEAVIPIMGYLYWNWDSTFIALFYFLDWLLAITLMVAKGKKRLEFSGQLPEKNQFKKGVGKALILLFLSIIMAAFGFYFLLPNLNWGTRIWEFLSYSDMGIPQGIVLLPLMILNGIMLYKQHYIMPAKYRTTIIKHIIQPLVNQGLILLIASAVFLGSTFIINYPQEIIIAIMVLGISSYRWIMRVTPI